MAVQVHELNTNLQKEPTFQHITAITNSAHIISSEIWSTWLGYNFQKNKNECLQQESKYNKEKLNCDVLFNDTARW